MASILLPSSAPQPQPSSSDNGNLDSEGHLLSVCSLTCLPCMQLHFGFGSLHLDRLQKTRNDTCLSHAEDVMWSLAIDAAIDADQGILASLLLPAQPKVFVTLT